METHAIAACFSLVAIIGQIAFGQNVVTKFPTSVAVELDGTATIHFRDVTPMTIEQAIGQLPDQIPLGEVQADGTVRPGILIQNETSNTLNNIGKIRPGRVILQATGEWTLQNGLAHFADASFEPGMSQIVYGSESIPLYKFSSRGSEFSRPIREGFQPRNAEVSWSYDSANQPSSVSAEQVERLIGRAANLWQQLLVQSEFQGVFVVRWRNDLNASELAITEFPNSQPYSWQTAFESLLTFQFFNESSDILETSLYDALPNGSAIAYDYSGGNGASSTLRFPPALESQVFGFRNSLPSIISLNSNQPFDDDPGTTSTDISTGKYDLFGVLVHEMGHGLGFNSQVGAANPQTANEISLWDVFRLPLEFSTRRISDVEFQTRRRSLNQNLLATFISALDLPLSYTVEDSSAHWLALDGARVGLMDPTLQIGTSAARNGTFIQRADARAFDVIGYNLVPESILPPAPGVSSLTSPSRVATTVPVQLSWEPSGYVQSFDVFVKDPAGVSIFRQNDLADPTVVIPANILSPGMTYSWVVLAYNWNGFFRSEAATFQTTSLCDADVNQDGNVDQDDVDYLIGIVAGGPNPVGADPDFNQDGNADQNDVDALIDVVAGGNCP